MLSNILSKGLCQYFAGLNYNYINEIRFRANKPIVINIQGQNRFLTKMGTSVNIDDAIYSTNHDINEMLKRASENSLYAIHDQLTKGFVSIAGGIRIGVCGEVVENDGKISTIKNINSLNVRIPHKVKNCSLRTYLHVVNNGAIRNTLVIAPPGAGKTTYIRDLIEQISIKNPTKNVLIVDERSEISATCNGVQMLNIGPCCDIYTNSSKQFAFENGIRSMKPDVIVTDEINLESDLFAIRQAISSGVSVIATIHANSVYDLKMKPRFDNMIKDKVFDRYIVLSSSNGPGTLEGVFNENLVCVGN